MCRESVERVLIELIDHAEELVAEERPRLHQEHGLFRFAVRPASRRVGQVFKRGSEHQLVRKHGRGINDPPGVASTGEGGCQPFNCPFSTLVADPEQTQASQSVRSPSQPESRRANAPAVPE